MSAIIGKICDALELCRRAKPHPQVFGLDSHEFVLNLTVEPSVVATFEISHNICLPDGYREFITKVGNGGAGPYYGVFKLGEMDSDFDYEPWKENNGFIGILSEPFPHINAWNDLTLYPDEEATEDVYEAQLDEFEKIYWNSSLVNGAIPICHQGCALRNWLVVTGLEAGNVWEDHRSEQKGLFPVRTKSKRRVTFLEWYYDWLQDAIAMLPKSP